MDENRHRHPRCNGRIAPGPATRQPGTAKTAPDLAERLAGPAALARRIEALAVGHERFVVAIAGPPGCGKSTLASELGTRITLPSCVVPMDGFHLDNRTLSERGLLQRKGAPETFDVQGFSELIAAIRRGDASAFPTFDRDADRVIADGGSIPADTRVLIFEGNYLLFDEPVWAELAGEWDASVWIDVPDTVLENRLIQRWLGQGMARDAARERAESNDMANARRAQRQALPPTWRVGPWA